MDFRRAVPQTLGIITLAGVGLLLLWDIFSNSFPARSHDFLAAFPLAMIAVVWLIHEGLRRPACSEIVKAVLLACAFLFWAANQLWPTLRQATLFNDIAIALFVFDVFLAIIGRQETTPSAIRRAQTYNGRGLTKAADK